MRSNKNNQKGITLLEYTAGAAIIIGIVWAAMFSMGNELNNVFANIATWAGSRANQIGNGH